LAALTALKFFFLLAEGGFDISQAPVVFILPIVVIGGVVLAMRRRRVGAWLVAAVSLILGAVLLAALIRRGAAQQNWADAVLVFGGLPLAAAAVVAAVLTLRH
jgi:hypothetical protein